MEVTDATIIVRVLIAMGIGGLIGLEREFKQKPAGVRTHMLVAGASCLLLLLSGELVTIYEATEGQGAATDPTRIVQAIVVGISFIGAGTIFKSDKKQNVLHLTTAASILFTSALGIAVGIGLYMITLVLAAITIGILFILGQFEDKVID